MGVVHGRVALGALCALSIVVAGSDVAVATMRGPVGATYAGRVLEQIDGKTFVVDIGGPPKEGVLRGLVTVRANRATRFIFTGGTRAGPTLYGSLRHIKMGPTTPVQATLGPRLADGSYRLLALMTITR